MNYPADSGGGTPTVLKMTDGAVATVKARFTDLASECQGIAEDLEDGYATVTASCGSFFAQIDPGITSFTASWQVTMMLTADEATAIATNVHSMYVDVSDVDRTLAG